MKVSSIPSLLLNQVLPGAGAAVTMGVLGCSNVEEITLLIRYILNGGSVTGAPTVRIRWNFPTPAWAPIPNPVEGVIIAPGPSLVVEDWPFVTPGAAGSWQRVLNLIVPPGATSLSATIRETGDVANPGNVQVEGMTGTE